MDSFGVDKFQSIVEKIFNNSRTLSFVWERYGVAHAQIGAGIAANNTLIGPGHHRAFICPVVDVPSAVHAHPAFHAFLGINGRMPVDLLSGVSN